MLKPNRKTKSASKGGRFAIVASRYNSRYVNGMIRGAQTALRSAGAREITVIRVPGAFEIPIVVSQLARTGPDAPDAILCLGVIIQGETSHAEHIVWTITEALMRLQLNSGVPCIHEVLLVKNKEQARARCLDPRMNRGCEAAQTAITMVETMRRYALDSEVPF